MSSSGRSRLPDGAWSTTGGPDRTVRVWDADGRCIASVATGGAINDAAWGTILVVEGPDGPYGFRFERGEIHQRRESAPR
jgi:WD40 repeat protein